jgi:hypothetical protein
MLNPYRNRDAPSGYKLSMFKFENGEPVAAADNTTASIDILANVDNQACPDKCFRPVGLAFDDQGRLFMSSDATGEIYVIVQESPTSTSGSSPQQSSQAGIGFRTGAAALSTVGLVGLAGYLVFA